MICYDHTTLCQDDTLQCYNDNFYSEMKVHNVVIILNDVLIVVYYVTCMIEFHYVMNM